MTFTKYPDEELDDPTLMALGRDGTLLRHKMLMWSNKQLTDGFIPEHMLPVLATLSFIDTRAARDRAVGALMAHGFAHAPGETCESPKCPASESAVPAGHLLLHEFWKDQERSKVVKERRDKNSRKKDLLGDEFLMAQLLARDGHRCRYCGRRVQRRPNKDTRSPDRLTVDHIDPDGSNIIENLVIACAPCNTAKGRRTPDEANMDLLPAPRLAQLRHEPLADVVDQGADQTTDQTTDHAHAVVGGHQNQTTDQSATTPRTTDSSRTCVTRERDTHDSGRTTGRGMVGGRSGGGPGLVGGVVDGWSGAGGPGPPPPGWSSDVAASREGNNQ